MARRKTNAEFRKELFDAHGNAIIPLEKYKGSQTKIRVKCRHCGFVWGVRPYNLCRGKGCPHCTLCRRRKTDAEFKKELFNAQGDAVIPLEKYKGYNTKIKVKCRHCGLVWKTRPNDLCCGHSCPRCDARRRSKTDLEFRKDLHKVHGNTIIPLEKYKNAYTKIKVKCRHCGLVWKALPTRLCRGSGCPRCDASNQGSHRKTNAEFQKKLYRVHGNAIIPLEKYKGCHTKIRVKCQHCGFVWKVIPTSLYKGCGCPRCDARRRSKTDLEFRKDLHKVHGNAIIPLEKYKGCNTKIKVKCRHCGLVWKVIPTSLYKGCGCPRCGSIKRRTTNAEFQKDLYKIHGNAIIPLEKYKGYNTKIKVKCHHCGLVWKTCPHELYKGSGCPHCDRGTSYDEKYIYHYLHHHLHAHFDYGYIILANGLHFDFWIPSMRLAIEYDGAQHFEYVPYFCGNNPKRFKESVHRDCCKNHYCLHHHITLIRIQCFREISDYIYTYHIIDYILSHVFSAYRHHHLYTHIYRFDVNNYGHLLHNLKKNA